MSDRLLEIRELRTQFATPRGRARALDGVSLNLSAGRTLGIVGESGCGKTVLGRSILRLIPEPPGIRAGGEVIFDGRDLQTLDEVALRGIRGREIAMIFQDPMTSLNPFLSVADQLTEVTVRHLRHTRKQATDHAVEMLERVGIPSAARRIFDYPHQFSGGMRQRVMIAMALSCKPDLVIADEPTTALDVTIQAQILDLMRNLQRDEGTAIILITHDMGVIAAMAHRVHVMYAGRIVEEAGVDELFTSPRHPYTLGLLKSIPRVYEPPGTRLLPIAGQPPDLAHLPPGCSFLPRCPYSVERCAQAEPPLAATTAGHRAACFVDVTTVQPH